MYRNAARRTLRMSQRYEMDKPVKQVSNNGQENIHYVNAAKYPSVTHIGFQEPKRIIGSCKRYESHTESVLFQSHNESFSPPKHQEPKYDESLFKIISDMEQSDNRTITEQVISTKEIN